MVSAGLESSLVEAVLQNTSDVSGRGCVLLIGSALADMEAARDVDVIVGFEGAFSRRFRHFQHRGKPCEVEIVARGSLRSPHEHYYWYPTDLVGELGKLRNARVLLSSAQAWDELIESLRHPQPSVRKFVILHHLGNLLQGSHAKKRGQLRYGPSPEWSFASILCAVWDVYPISMNRASVLSCLPPSHRESISRILDTESDLLEQSLRYVERYADGLFRSPALGTDDVVFFPQELAAAVALHARLSLPPPRLDFQRR